MWTEIERMAMRTEPCSSCGAKIGEPCHMLDREIAECQYMHMVRVRQFTKFPIQDDSPVQGAVDFSDCPMMKRGKKCRCGYCEICGNQKHTSVHGPLAGESSGSRPWGHEYKPVETGKIRVQCGGYTAFVDGEDEIQQFMNFIDKSKPSHLAGVVSFKRHGETSRYASTEMFLKKIGKWGGK